MSLRFSTPLRRVAACLIFLSFIVGMVVPSAAIARNTYQLSDGTEGDPGDGVLNPSPDVEPDPAPIRGPMPEILTVYFQPQPDGSLRPVIVLRTIPPGFRWFTEGRWHRAP